MGWITRKIYISPDGEILEYNKIKHLNQSFENWKEVLNKSVTIGLQQSSTKQNQTDNKQSNLNKMEKIEKTTAEKDKPIKMEKEEITTVNPNEKLTLEEIEENKYWEEYHPDKDEEIVSTSEEVEIRQIHKTPFLLVKEKGKKDRLTIGNYVIAEGDESELRDRIRAKDWNLILGLISVGIENYNMMVSYDENEKNNK